MDDKKAEEIVQFILEQRASGINDEEKIIVKLMDRYETNEDSCRWAIEMVNTGAFRAGIISGGHKYPKGNLNVEDDPILKASFKLAWIDFKGLEHYEKNYLKKKKKINWRFWLPKF